MEYTISFFKLRFLIISLSAILRFIIFIIWIHFMDILKLFITSIVEIIILRGIVFLVKFSNLLWNHLWWRWILIRQSKFLIRSRHTPSFSSSCIDLSSLLVITIYVIISIGITSRLFKFLGVGAGSHSVFSYLIDVLLFWSHLWKAWPQKTTNIAFSHPIIIRSFHISPRYSQFFTSIWGKTHLINIFTVVIFRFFLKLTIWDHA